MKGIGAVQTTFEEYGEGSSPAALTGRVIAGRYRIIRSLGQGGMASVYLAEDLVLGKSEVAIKILKSRVNDHRQSEIVERFIREVQLTHRINHKHVVRTFDFGRDGSTLFYTMEYLPGVALDRIISAGGLDVATVTRFAGQLLKGLAAIHSVGVVHRDLKPANIILSGSGNLTITDFGVARSNAAQRTALATEVLGTLAYVSPEVVQGEVATRASDYYALGVILYEMLVGQPPFHSDNPAQIILAKLEEQPALVTSVRADAPRWLVTVIHDLLSRDPLVRGVAIQELARRCSVENSVKEGWEGGVAELRRDISEPALERRGVLATTGAWVRQVRAGVVSLLLVVLCGMAAIPFRSSSIGIKLEEEQLDNLFAMRGARIPHPDVMVVAIDEQSYSHAGVALTQPWPRALHARLLHILADAGVKRVVFDVLFTEADESSSTDSQLAQAMTRVPTVVGAALGLAQKATANGAFLLEELLKPANMFERESVGIGVVGLPERRGRVRNFFSTRSSVFPNVSSLSEMAVLADRGSREQPGRADLINFYGPAKTIPTVSYDMVLDNPDRAMLRRIFEGKIVFVGLSLKSRTGPSQRDAFVTPFDSSTYGTEIHATIASNLLQNSWLRQPPQAVQLVAVVCVATAIALAIVLASGGPALLVLALLVLVTMGTQYVLFLFDMYLAISSGLLWGALSGILVRVAVVPGAERSRWRRR